MSTFIDRFQEVLRDLDKGGEEARWSAEFQDALRTAERKLTYMVMELINSYEPLLPPDHTKCPMKKCKTWTPSLQMLVNHVIDAHAGRCFCGYLPGPINADGISMMKTYKEAIAKRWAEYESFQKHIEEARRDLRRHLADYGRTLETHGVLEALGRLGEEKGTP